MGTSPLWTNLCLSDGVKPMERWKDIPGYEGIYQASDTGLIRTKPGKTTYTERHGVRHWKTRVLKPKCQIRKGNTGKRDARVNLWKDGKEKTWLVSRLVALTWCDGYSDGMTVDHIDGNPGNNSCTNLEWVSLTENIKRGWTNGMYDKCMKKMRSDSP